MIFFIAINIAILIMLSFIHVYWAMGGSRGMKGVLPTFKDGHQPKPGIIGTFAVAAALGVFAFIIAGNLGLYDEFIEHRFIKYATLGIGSIFTLRAIGDFKNVGFFKKSNGTLFAKNDLKYFSPLCLYIGLSTIAIALWQ